MVKSWQEVVDMTDELPEEVQRWTAKRRTALIVSIIRGETSVHEAARKHGLTVAEVEDWREKFLSAAENALRTKPRGDEAEGRADQEAQAEGRGARPRHRHPQGGPEGTPFRPGDVRRVREVFPHASERRVCRLLEVPRSAMSDRCSKTQKEPTTDHLLTDRIEELIQKHPTFGYRRLWALLRFRDGLLVNRKTVYRILKLKGWFCHERRHTPRPRVKGLRSHAEKSNQRWAMDLTHIHCGADGWGHLAAVIDCHDREIVGYELSLIHI